MNQASTGDPIVGTVLDGRYEILERIGEGGTGVVYKARQRPIDRVVAVKMLTRQLAGDPSWVQRFYNEAKASSRLAHPNTIRMFDFGQTSDGRLYMAMEYLDGQSLRAAIATSSPMMPARALKVLIQCCGSLAEAHSVGIVHRDIKPDNVFLLNLAGSPDHVKVLDFSVAKLLQENAGLKTQAGMVFGTPQYMSPEQGRGFPLDARSDLYALGVLGFEMLTGKPPFDDDNPLTVLQYHITKPPPLLPPAVPAPVKEIINRALEKDPARRFASAVEMMTRCQEVFAMVVGSTPPPMPALAPPQHHGPAPHAAISDAGRVAGPEAATAVAGRTLLARGPAGPDPAAPAQTMLLADSEGIISYVQHAQLAQAAQAASATPGHGAVDQTGVTGAGGASVLFWIVCLAAGLAIGVAAYWLVVSLGG